MSKAKTDEALKQCNKLLQFLWTHKDAGAWRAVDGGYGVSVESPRGQCARQFWPAQPLAPPALPPLSFPPALRRPPAEPFREPVKWKEWGLLDYPKVVKNPMDLGSVQVRVRVVAGGGWGAVVV